MVFPFSRYQKDSPLHEADPESTDALLQHDPSEVNSAENLKLSTTVDKSISSWPPSPLNVLAVLFCVACTTLNLYLSIAYPTSIVQNSGANLRTFSRNKYNNLRRPSPFIGFDEISRPSPPTPRSLINYPMILALVNASNPGQVFDDDPKRHLTSTGSVSPEEKLLMITNSVSTIAQFRAIDYGMERCELNLRILPESITPLLQPIKISIYRLGSELPVDTKILSYSTRPTRLNTIATISMDPSSGVEWSHEFKCAWDSLLTFEVAYFSQGVAGFDDEGGFSIQWWQNKEKSNPAQGVFLNQRETV